MSFGDSPINFPRPGEGPKEAADRSWRDNARRRRFDCRLPIETMDDIAIPSAPDRLVKRLIGEASAAVIYGPSTAGKSFLALDIAAHVATGTDWFGRKVMPGAVLYVAAEGAAGFRNRIIAWKARHRMVSGTPFAMSATSIDLGPQEPGAEDTGNGAQAVIEAAKAAAKVFNQPIRLIVIDTLARTMGAGDENVAKDMGAFVEAVETIRRETGATVLIVHHTGKDLSRGERGSSSLRAAIDTSIEVLRDEEGPIRRAMVKKQKDGADGIEIPFTLDVVDIGIDDDGDPITSCVVTAAPDDAGERKGRTVKISDRQRLILDQLDNLLIQEGVSPPPLDMNFPASVKVVADEKWKATVFGATIYDATSGGRAKWSNDRTNLMGKGVIRVLQGFVWRADR